MFFCKILIYLVVEWLNPITNALLFFHNVACNFLFSCAVHYEGKLADTGAIFDTTYEDNSIFSFEIGTGSVIKAWDIALRSMKVGEISKITCKPNYAYGSAGALPEIPPE